MYSSTFPQYAIDYPDHYEAGKQAARNGSNTYEHFVKTFGHPPVAGSPQWIACIDGFAFVEEEKKAAKRVAYRVDEFLSKLSALCREYDAHISSDYDGAILDVKDYSTSLSHVGPDDIDIQ